MVSLHHLIENIQSGSMTYNKHLDHEFYTGEQMRRGLYWMKRAICFDIGRAVRYWEMSSNTADFLPFDNCYFEGDWKMVNRLGNALKPDRVIRFGVHMCKQEDGSKCVCMPYIKVGNVWRLEDVAILDLKKNSYHTAKEQENEPDASYSFTMCIMCFIEVLGCINTDKKINFPPAKLQKKRIKNNKQPLFKYYTLDLKIPNLQTNGDSMNADHHWKQKLHVRRGHTRVYKRTGTKYKVPSYVAGDIKRGLIIKNYKATI